MREYTIKVASDHGPIIDGNVSAESHIVTTEAGGGWSIYFYVNASLVRHVGISPRHSFALEWKEQSK